MVALLCVFVCLGLGAAPSVVLAQEDPAEAAAKAPPIVRAIEIEGNRLILPSTVTFNMKTKVGDRFSLRRLREDIEELYRKEFFDDIQVYAREAADGIVLVISVKEKPRIRRIDFIGNNKIKDDRLLELTELKVNGLFRQSLIEKTIRAIREEYLEKGYNYAQVEIVPEQLDGANVVVAIRITEHEKVKIHHVEFLGNETFKDGKLRRQMKNNKRRFLTKGKFKPDLLPADIELINHFYLDRGYLRAQIAEPEIEILDPRLFKVREKERSIESKLAENLRKQAAAENWANDRLTEELTKAADTAKLQVSKDQARAEKQIKKKGGKKGVYITIPLEEGDPYTIKDIAVTGNTIYEEELVEKAYKAPKTGGMFSESVFVQAKSKVRTGATYSKSAMDKAVESIQGLYSTKGYIQTNVFPLNRLDDHNLTVDITFDITEGDQAWIRTIEFRGNNRTRDKVLRRELLVQEGDVMNLTRFRSSLERLFSLGYVENPTPDLKVDPKDNSQVDVEIKLDDARRTELQVSGGYSSYDQFVFSGSITEYNLLGYGQELSLSLTLGRFRQIYSLSFSDPYFLDTPYFFSSSIYNTLRAYDKYDRAATGGSVFFGKKLGPWAYTRLGYRYEQVNIKNVPGYLSTLERQDPGALTAEEKAILDASGISDTSSVTWVLGRDRRNNRRDATRGSFQNLTAEYAGGLLGGTNTFYKWQGQLIHYVPVVGGTFLAGNLEAGYASSFNRKRLPVFEYFHLGGETSIRGTEFDTFGPLDANRDTVGGNKKLQVNLEYVVPIAGPLRIAAFFDIGDVWGLDEDIDLNTMRKTTGLELRFLVPQFWVPIRFIYGYNLDAYEGLESKSSFQFAIGSVF